MKSSTKQSLLSLAKSKDADKIIFGLKSLAHEDVDSDFKEVGATLFSGINQIKEKTLEDSSSDLTESLRLLKERIGQAEYLTLMADMDSKHGGKIHIYLSACEPFDIREGYDALAKIASWPDLSETSIKWLVRAVIGSNSPNSTAILYPFFDLIAQKMLKEKMDEEDDQISRLISEDSEIVTQTLQSLQDISLSDNKAASGMILAVRFSKNDELVSEIGPFIESIGTWDRIIKIILTEERARQLFDRAKEVGLDSALKRLRGDSISTGKDLPELISEDHEFRRALAKLVSTQNSFIAICRVLASSQMYSIMKDMFADSDLPSRRAAAVALSEIGTPAAIPFLKSGLVDKDKAVRQLCSCSLQSILGEERFNEMLSEMKSETSSLVQKMKGIANLSDEALSSIKSVLSLSGKAIGDGAAWVGDQAKGLSDKFKWSPK